MKKKERLFVYMGILFLILFTAFAALGRHLSSKKLNQVISYHADGSSLYAAVYDPYSSSYMICQNDFLTGKEYGMRIPVTNEKGERYSLRYLGKESPGKTAVLADVFSEDSLIRSEVWLCTPKEQDRQVVYTHEYDESGGWYLEMFTDANGILLIEFEDMAKGTDMTRVKRTLIYSGSDGTPVALAPLRLWNMTSSIYYVSSSEGIWYTDRYGNVHYCGEDGVTVYMLKNDGSRVSINNVGYSPTRRGFYFYNLDDEKDYWIGPDGKLTEYDGPALDALREEGYQIKELGIDGSDVVYADISKDEQSGDLAVMVPGKETQILTEVIVPVNLWLPYCLVVSALAAVLITALAAAVIYIYGSLKVVPVSVKILTAVLVILLGGGVFVYVRVQSVFYEKRLDSAQEVLCDAAILEAGMVDQTKMKGDAFDVNYFEERISRKENRVWKISGMSQEEIRNYQMEYSFGYFRILGEDAYPILGTDYVTTPARYTQTESEMLLLNQCLDGKKAVCGIYMENGIEYLAAYSPIFSESGELTGAVKTSKALQDIKDKASEDSYSLNIRILLGLFGISAVVIAMIHGSLRPLKQLMVFMSKIEDNENQSRMTVKGHNEVSEILSIFNRMDENIRGYLNKVKGMEEKYGAFVPNDLVGLMGKEDIRQVEPGDSVICPSALVTIHMAEFSGLQSAAQGDEMFRMINEGLHIMIPRVKEAGGQIVRFFEGGMIVLFPQKAEDAVRCTKNMLNCLEEVCRPCYHAAVDYRNVKLEIIGSESRMDFTIRPEDWSLAYALFRLAAAHGLGAVASDTLAEKICEETAHVPLRYLGKVRRKEDGEVLGLYELLDEKEEEQFALKNETLEMFEQGVAFFAAGHFAESRECFARILRKNGHDRAARRYFDLCDRFLMGSSEEKDVFFDEI